MRKIRFICTVWFAHITQLAVSKRYPNRQRHFALVYLRNVIIIGEISFPPLYRFYLGAQCYQQIIPACFISPRTFQVPDYWIGYAPIRIIHRSIRPKRKQAVPYISSFNCSYSDGIVSICISIFGA